MKIQNDATLPKTYIVEFQPNNVEDSMSIVGIRSQIFLTSRPPESIKTSEESNITMGDKGIIETSEAISLDLIFSFS